MTKLETYLHQLDNSNFDFQNEHQIKKELNDVAEQLRKEGRNEDANLAILNSIVFSIQKSFNYIDNPEEGQIRGLSYTYSGTRTLEDGSYESVFVPDVTKLTIDDFEYFEKRYKEAINLYVKTEYGLLVYFGGKTKYSKHQDFERQLFGELFQLSKNYYEKRNEKFRYSHHSYLLLELAWGIVKGSKLKEETVELASYMFDIIKQLEITEKNDLWTLTAYSNLLSNNYTDAKAVVDFKPIIEKNFEAAKEKEKDDLHGALYIADLCVRMTQQIGGDKSVYLAYKAGLYEKLAIEAESQGNMAVVHFTEKALHLYKELKMEEDAKRLETYYNEMRGKAEMQEFGMEISDDYIEELQNQINKTIAESSEQEILGYFKHTPWYRTIDEINRLADKMKGSSVLKSLIPVKVIDKFGNTVGEYVTDEEREEFNFWETYGFHFQLGSQTMYRFFIKAYQEHKLSYDSVVSYLETTWFNDLFVRNYAGSKVEVKPIDTLKPGLKRIFDELDRFDVDSSYQYDTVTIIDSLTLKIEGLLRFFCERIGIPTFKPRQKGSNKVIMEKLLDDLLSDVAHKPKWNPEQITGFDEEDRIMLKYVLSEKVGLNLRNKVAHGLMDIFEYNFQLVVILFSLILKLSKYSFKEINGGENESNSK